jgi:DNA-binding MarR family transcriptional regulator
MTRRELAKLDECRDCVCLAVRTAARRITQGYDAALAGTGLRVTQFSLLVMAHHLGAPPMKRLAQMLNSDPTTITRNVQGLAKRRLLTLSPGRDLRERKVTLTEKGEAILLRALPNWRAAQSDVVASLSRAELTRLRALLEQVGQHKRDR